MIGSASNAWRTEKESSVNASEMTPNTFCDAAPLVPSVFDDDMFSFVDLVFDEDTTKDENFSPTLIDVNGNDRTFSLSFDGKEKASPRARISYVMIPATMKDEWSFIVS